MNITTIKKRLEFHTQRLDNLYTAYNKLLSGGVKSSPGSTSASLAMKSKRPSRKSMNWNRC